MRNQGIDRISLRSTSHIGGALLFAGTVLVAVSCGGANNPISPSSLPGVPLGSDSAADFSPLAGGDRSSMLSAGAKTPMCHLTNGTNEVVMVPVAANAVQTHLDHGDWFFAPASLPGASFGSSRDHSPAESPGMAFDGNPMTLWNAGSSAEQFIEVDFGADRPLWEITAVVAQTPGGSTTHEVMLNGTLAFTWTGNTSNGDVLTHSFGTLQTVRHVRIRTIRSPSWIAWYEIALTGCPAQGVSFIR